MRANQSGFVIVLVLTTVLILSLIAFSYLLMTQSELISNRGSQDTTTGFYAAEGGLNLRAEAIRAVFNDRTLPTGVSPTASPTDTYCLGGGSQGSQDFECKDYVFSTANVKTYVEDVTNGSPISGTVPIGDEFAGLLYQGYQYDVFSTAYNSKNLPSAILQMRFTSRLIPLFQFAIFYDKDLEFDNSATISIGGRVHTNNDLYVNPGSSSMITLNGATTAVGNIFRGQKNQNTCTNVPGNVRVRQTAGNLQDLNCSGSTRTSFVNNQLLSWNGGLLQGVPKLTPPSPSAFDPAPGASYWDNAELRIIFNTNSNQIEVKDSNGGINGGATNALANCTNAVIGSSTAFYDRREGKFVKMLEADMGLLLSCIRNNASNLNVPNGLANSSDNGLVLYMTVSGPDENNGSSGYGVRLRNGSNLNPNGNTRGISVVSNQPIYIEGNYNSSSSWVPAAVMGDVINILSNNYSSPATLAQSNNVNGENRSSGCPSNLVKGLMILDCRPASDTIIRAAIIGATGTTGGVEGAAGRDQGAATGNGGVNNMMRFHEEWGGNGGLIAGPRTFTYAGSLVSLNQPRRMSGVFSVGGPVRSGRSIYNPPLRNWSFDTRFNIADRLPPLSPRAVSLKQERFNRSFDRTTR